MLAGRGLTGVSALSLRLFGWLFPVRLRAPGLSAIPYRSGLRVPPRGGEGAPFWRKFGRGGLSVPRLAYSPPGSAGGGVPSVGSSGFLNRSVYSGSFNAGLFPAFSKLILSVIHRLMYSEVLMCSADASCRISDIAFLLILQVRVKLAGCCFGVMV